MPPTRGEGRRTSWCCPPKARGLLLPSTRCRSGLALARTPTGSRASMRRASGSGTQSSRTTRGTTRALRDRRLRARSLMRCSPTWRGCWCAVSLRPSSLAAPPLPPPDLDPPAAAAVGVVHVSTTALRGVSLIPLALGAASRQRLTLLSHSPRSGPVGGNTRVTLIGQGLAAFAAAAGELARGGSRANAAACVCVWRCGHAARVLAPALAEDTVSSALHVVNDTHAVCMSPWRPAAGECELGVGVGVASGMHKACPQGARQASE